MERNEQAITQGYSLKFCLQILEIQELLKEVRRKQNKIRKMEIEVIKQDYNVEMAKEKILEYDKWISLLTGLQQRGYSADLVKEVHEVLIFSLFCY